MKKIVIGTVLMILCIIILTSCMNKEKREVNIQMMSTPDDVELSFLPLGSISAKGWLLNQLKLQRNNITGQFESISPDVLTTGEKRSGWLGGSGESWERGSYYTRGLVLLAYTLDDNELKQKAQLWIDSFINSQTESGAAGPYADKPEFDWWAIMPMLIALEEYYDATADDRVIPFLDKYFKYQYATLDSKPLKDWGQARAGDNILAVKWLYDKTNEPYLLELCLKLYELAYDWKASYENGSWAHIVNTHQSFKLFPLMYSITGDDSYRDVYYRGLQNLFKTSGRVDGMSSGDELSGDIGSTHGTETCAVAEQMFCDAIALKCLKDPLIADHLERVTFNAWPSQLTPEITGQVYFTMQNQIEATLGYHGFTSDGGDRSVYGTPGGYPCCIHNFHMGWPEYVSNLWLKTSDNGLIVTAYSPCEIKATVGNGTNVTLTETTNYPFEDTVNIKINAEKTDTYPIYLRVPYWCNKAKIYINNSLVAESAGAYVKLETEWKSGDNIRIVMPMEIKADFMENNSLGLSYGPLVYAVSLKEDWEKTDYVSNDWNVTDKFSSYNITSKSKWNYALEVDFKKLSDCFTIKRDKNYDYNNLIFKYDKSPIELVAKGALVPEWKYDERIKGAGELPVSPIKDYEKTDKIKLIPYSFARLRISLIPWYSRSDETVSYAPSELYRVNNRIVFNTVTAPIDTLDPYVKFGATPVQNYIGTFSYNVNNDTNISVYVNNVLITEMTLKESENSFKCTFPLQHGWYNLVEIKGDISDCSLTITSEGTVNEYKWEAENITILGKAQHRGNHVGGIDNVGDGISFDINVTKSDNYNFKILYAAAMGNATHDLLVDDIKIGTVDYNKTSLGWANFSEDVYTENTVYLTEGKHTITIKKASSSGGFAEIDAIKLILNYGGKS